MAPEKYQQHGDGLSDIPNSYSSAADTILDDIVKQVVVILSLIR